MRLVIWDDAIAPIITSLYCSDFGTRWVELEPLSFARHNKIYFCILNQSPSVFIHFWIASNCQTTVKMTHHTWLLDNISKCLRQIDMYFITSKGCEGDVIANVVYCYWYCRSSLVMATDIKKFPHCRPILMGIRWSLNDTRVVTLTIIVVWYM